MKLITFEIKAERVTRYSSVYHVAAETMADAERYFMARYPDGWAEYVVEEELEDVELTLKTIQCIER
ncbi:hypothetical protein PQR14_36255 [Paraburkholderia bryophila]|jgi:hypothetical protein|uniref:hypothetical protein n=1 Tax=Paraburkholderia TaxID=1822464 RepID=UPI000E76F1DE